MGRRSGIVITQALAEHAPKGLLWDALIPGFGIKKGAPHTGTWLLKYRVPSGAQRWFRIGGFPLLSADEARAQARRLRASVEQGGDPSRGVPARPSVCQPLAELTELYARQLDGRPSMRGPGIISSKQVAAETRAVREAIRRMGIHEAGAHEATARHVLDVLRQEAARPATARLIFGALSRFFDWCHEQGIITANPCHQVPRSRRPRAPRPRARVVAMRDLARLWLAADALPPPQGDLARLLIALPVRRGEAMRIAWQDLDLDAGAWDLPGTITKNGDPHRLTLHALILCRLRELHAANKQPARGLVFPGLLSGGPYKGWTRTKLALNAASGLDAWTWHDFRRSFATHMAEDGVAEAVADAILNHRQAATRGGVLGVYQLARRWPEQRAALDSWGAALKAAIATERKRQAPARLPDTHSPKREDAAAPAPKRTRARRSAPGGSRQSAGRAGAVASPRPGPQPTVNAHHDNHEPEAE